MKNDLLCLTREIERKIGKKIPAGSDFEKLASFFAVKHHIKLNAEALRKVWHYVSGKEKPTKKTLNKLALFLVYQCWDDFHEALHGDDDGNLNYEVDEEKKGKSDLADFDDI